MTRSSTQTHKIANSKALHAFVFVIAMISFMLNGSNARAASVMPSDYRLATAGDKFMDTWQFTVAFKMRPPRRLRSFRTKRMELAVGTISTSQENRRSNIKTEAVALSSINPGMGMIGLNITFNFSNRKVHRTGETS